MALWLSGAISACVTQGPVPTGAETFVLLPNPLTLHVVCSQPTANNFMGADQDLSAAENGFKPH